MHCCICDRNKGLHAAIEIARHHVGGTDIDDCLVGRQIIAISEAENTAMLQKAPDNRLGANIVGKPGTPGRRQQMPRTTRSICTPARLAT